jgi:hypothetical protein
LRLAAMRRADSQKALLWSVDRSRMRVKPVGVRRLLDAIAEAGG